MKAMDALLLVPLFFSSTLASFIVDKVTKTVRTCEPVLLQWQDGKQPWKLSVLAATDDSLLENLGTFPAETSFQWTANVEAGTAVYAQVTDSTGAVTTGNTFTVQSGTNDCAIIQNKLVASPPSSTTDNGSPTVTVHATVTTTSPPASSSSSQAAEPTPPPPSSSSPSPASKSTPSSTPSSSSQSSGLSTAAGTSPTTTATSLSMQYTSDAPSPSSSSSSSSPLSLAAAPSASHISRVGMAFAILTPLLVLVIVGFLLLRRRRRRREGALSALEAQPPSPHWFDRPAYQSAAAASAFNARAQNATQGPATPEVAFKPPPPALRPTLNIDIVPSSPTTTATGPGPETSRTPATGFLSALSDAEPPLASADPSSSKYVETLRSRIDALMAENALLAEMASSPQGGSPPPAYGLH